MGSYCRGCNSLIEWALTVNEKRIPFNPEPDPTGNLAIYRDERGMFRARTLSKEHPEPTRGERRFMPHHATCPKVDRFRKR